MDALMQNLLLRMLADQQFSKPQSQQANKPIDGVSYKTVKKIKKLLAKEAEEQKKADEAKKKNDKKPKLQTLHWVALGVIGIPLFLVSYPPIVVGAWKLSQLIMGKLLQ